MKKGMDTLPDLWEQDKITTTGRYRTEKLSSLLSEICQKYNAKHI